MQLDYETVLPSLRRRSWLRRWPFYLFFGLSVALMLCVILMLALDWGHDAVIIYQPANTAGHQGQLVSQAPVKGQ